MDSRTDSLITSVHRTTRAVAMIVVALLIAGCATSPDAPGVHAGPDPGWEMRVADTEIDVELPEPFVRLVDLGRLRVGMTKQEVLALFPDPVSTRLRGTDELWDYRFAELIFRGNYLRDWFNR